MNLQEFNEKYKDFKSEELIEISCDCPNHKGDNLKSMRKRNAKKNIEKNRDRHGKEEFMCESCYKSIFNPMKTNIKVPKPNDEITVICPHPEHNGNKSRIIQWSGYKGDRNPVDGIYKQICGTCWQLGKEITQEQRDKISEALKGHKRTPESIEKQKETWASNPENVAWAKELGSTYNDHYTNGMKGKHHSEETKKKMSDAHIGKPKSLETKMKMSAAQTKRQKEHPMTEETRNKISKSVLEKYTKGFQPKTNHLSGIHVSTKCRQDVYYKSSYELKTLIVLDEDPDVSSYFYERITTTYLNPKKNAVCVYIVDLLVEYKDGSLKLIEIKPRKMIEKDEVTKAKIERLKAVSQDMKIPYEVWDEYKLFGEDNTEEKARAFTEWLREKLYKEGLYCPKP